MNRTGCYLTGFLLALTANLANAQGHRLDLHGDPLPPGAIARLGTTRLRPGTAPQYLAFTPDSKQLICFAGVYGTGNYLNWYDVASGKELRRIELLDMRAHAVQLLPDGRGLALMRLEPNEDNFFLWEFTDPKSLPRRPDTPLQGNISIQSTTFAISPDGKWLASGGRPSGKEEKPVQIWPWTSGKLLSDLKPVHTWPLGDHNAERIQFSASKELLVFSMQKAPTLLRFDLAKGNQGAEFLLPKKTNVRWSTLTNQTHAAGSTRQLVLAMSEDHGQILDLDTGKKLKEIPFANRTKEDKIPGLAT